MSRPSQPRPASQRCLSATWNLTSSDLDSWLWKRSIVINVLNRTAMIFTRRCIQKTRPVLLLGELILWVDTCRYLRVSLDKRLTWSSHIDKVTKKAAQSKCRVLTWTGVASPSGMMSCSTGSSSVPWCHIWRSAARSHVRKLQLPQSKYHCIAAGSPWYITNRKNHQDFGVSLRRAHHSPNRVTTQTLADAGNPFVRQLGRYLHWPRVKLTHLKRKPRVSEARQSVEAVNTAAWSTNWIVPSWHFSATLNKGSPLFSSVARRLWGCKSKMGHVPHSPSGTAASPKYIPQSCLFGRYYATQGSCTRKLTNQSMPLPHNS